MLSGKDQASVALGVLHVEVKAGLDELCEHGLIALACRFEILIAQALLDRQFVLSVSRYGQQAQHGREHQSVHDSLIEKMTRLWKPVLDTAVPGTGKAGCYRANPAASPPAAGRASDRPWPRAHSRYSSALPGARCNTEMASILS